VEYQGLGDDPADYRLAPGSGHIAVEDPHIAVPRPARDHRALVLERWSATRSSEAAGDAGAPAEARRRLDELMREGAEGRHHTLEYAKPMLRGLLNVVSLADPVTAAIVLFAQGLAGIHHLHRVHRLARRLGNADDARRVLGDVSRRLDRLPPERARQVIDVLLGQIRRG